MASETGGDDTYQPGTTSESQHGWAPDAPGEGEASDRAAEADSKAFEASEDTQAASRGDAQPPDYPEGVGESTTRRAEDVAREEGPDAGRYDSGTQGESQRPYGGSSAEASTGVDPQEPIDDNMPNTQTGDQGG